MNNLTVSNGLTIAKQQLNSNLSEISEGFVGPIIPTYSKSKEIIDRGGEANCFFDMVLEKNLGQSIECYLLCVKFLAKAIEDKTNTFIESLQLLPTDNWATDERLIAFKEKYSSMYKIEEGPDLLLYIPEISGVRHLFCKGQLKNSVPLIVNQAISGEKSEIIKLSLSPKSKGQKEWFSLPCEKIPDYERKRDYELPDYLDSEISKFLTPKEVSNQPQEQKSKKKGR